MARMLPSVRESTSVRGALSLKTALLFAGQATQYVGMGRALFDRYPIARQCFEEADDALGEALSDLIFDGPIAQLNLTENTQPAVLTVAHAAYGVLAERGFVPDVVAGHSLGEYAALTAGNALDFADAVRLTRRRGRYMQEAVPLGEGAMAAVLRVDEQLIEAACREVEGICQPAVYNAPGIVVISGEIAAVNRACERLKSLGGRINPLPVSAPFHSLLLTPAAERLRKDLAEINFKCPTIPYISNVDAAWQQETTADEIRALLVEQVVKPVRWRHSITLMLERGVQRFWHVGPGRTNLTHVKRQSKSVVCESTDNPADLEKMLADFSV
jgi:[acyl-carrier-protein] S-malonyltransferase